MIRQFGLCCCLVLVLMPRSAAAEWHMTPMVGLTMLGSTSIVDLEQATDDTHGNFGGAVAWLSRGIFGLEGLVVWTPGFFDGDPDFEGIVNSDLVRSSRALSIMGNVVVTLPQRWTEYGLRPFVSGGIGLMHVHFNDSTPTSPGVYLPTENVLGFNVGGGAIGFLSPQTGVRFDARYHSNLTKKDEVPPYAFAPVHVRYFTLSIGLVIRR